MDHRLVRDELGRATGAARTMMRMTRPWNKRNDDDAVDAGRGPCRHLSPSERFEVEQCLRVAGYLQRYYYGARGFAAGS
jgi:hypothetical protein